MTVKRASGCRCPLITYVPVEVVAGSAQLSNSGPLMRAGATFAVARWRARGRWCGRSKSGGGLRWRRGTPGCWFSHRRPVSSL